MVQISDQDSSSQKDSSQGPANSLLINAAGVFAIAIVVIYAAIRVKKAGLSLTSQTTIYSLPSLSATAAEYETATISQFITKSVNVVLNNSHVDSFAKFWKRFPTRFWNFYVNAFLIPHYRKEWGKYQTWSFQAPPRPRRPSLLKAVVEKLISKRESRKSKSISVDPSIRTSRSKLPPVKLPKEDDPYNPQPRAHNHAACRKVRINVGGCIYVTQMRTLNRFPQTLLGDPNRRLRHFNPVDQEYFFDRNQASFETILYYYQSGGRFKRPDNVSADILLDDAKFYGLPQSVIYQYLVDEGLSIASESEDILPANLLMRKIWLLFDYPQSSMQAQIVSLLSILAIVVSITTFCIETLEVLSGRYRYFMDTTTSAAYGVNVGIALDPHDPFFFTETMCSVWFIVEYVVRLASSPIKLKFITNTLNIIDLIAVIPYLLQYILPSDDESKNDEQDQSVIQSKRQGASLSIIRIVRLVRVFRIFKLSRHSKGLKILGKTLRASLNELVLLVFFVVIGVILFASTMYFAEVGEPTSHFHSIPDAFWWALITITTVGYGDDVPKTAGGKLVGAFCAVAGVLTLALPVPVIVSNFNFFYHQALGESDLSWIRINHSTPCPFRPMDGYAGEDSSPFNKRAHGGKRHTAWGTVCERFKGPPTYSSDEEFGTLKMDGLTNKSSSKQLKND